MKRKTLNLDTWRYTDVMPKAEVLINEPVTTAVVYYSWEDFGSGAMCAWCHKYRKDITFPNLHIRLHDLTDRAKSYFTTKGVKRGK